MAGEEHFINKPCAKPCAQPGHFGVKMAVKPKLVSVAGSTGKQIATESKIDDRVFNGMEEKNVGLYLMA